MLLLMIMLNTLQKNIEKNYIKHIFSILLSSLQIKHSSLQFKKGIPHIIYSDTELFYANKKVIENKNQNNKLFRDEYSLINLQKNNFINLYSATFLNN